MLRQILYWETVRASAVWVSTAEAAAVVVVAAVVATIVAAVAVAVAATADIDGALYPA